MHDRLNKPGARNKRLLIISPWETVWSLGREHDVKAGVSDDDRFIDACQIDPSFMGLFPPLRLPGWAVTNP